MSTIERMAELLRSNPEKRPNPPAAGERANDIDQGLIERAAGDLGRRRDFPDRKPAHSTGGATRTLAIDRNRLRQQSMISPDGERTPIAECFRRIKRQILANVASPKNGAPHANLIMVTSGLPG